jgi:hypothetical protein
MTARNYMVDIEAAGVESNSVVLSAAIIEFKLDEKPVYHDLLHRSMFVKFDAAYQIKNLKRVIDKSTMEWWSKQPELVRSKSLIPGIYDLDPELGLDVIRGYAHLDKDSSKNGDVTFWARGILDEACLDSLSNQVCGDLLIPYSNWRDVRTAVDLLCEGASRGYAKVPGFDRGIVLKHDPVHDCAYDIMMLLSNNLKDPV